MRVCAVGKNAGVLPEAVQAGDGMDLLGEIAPPVGSGERWRWMAVMGGEGGSSGWEPAKERAGQCGDGSERRAQVQAGVRAEKGLEHDGKMAHGAWLRRETACKTSRKGVVHAHDSTAWKLSVYLRKRREKLPILGACEHSKG